MCKYLCTYSYSFLYSFSYSYLYSYSFKYFCPTLVPYFYSLCIKFAPTSNLNHPNHKHINLCRIQPFQRSMFIILVSFKALLGIPIVFTNFTFILQQWDDLPWYGISEQTLKVFHTRIVGKKLLCMIWKYLPKI